MNIITVTIISVLGGLSLLILVGYVAGLLSQRIKESSLRYLLTLINEITYGAVIEVGETFVKDIKQKSKDGKLTIEEAKEAFSKAKNKIKETIGPKAVALAKQIGVEIDKLIDITIERLVSELKEKWTKKK